MPRRVAIYPHSPQWKSLNDWSTFGAILVGISMIVFVVNVGYSWKRYPAGDNPWDAQTLEWFHHLSPAAPQLLPPAPDQSERPTWDYNHPEHRSLATGSIPCTTTKGPRRRGRGRSRTGTGSRRVRVEAKILLGLGTFFGIMCAVYWNWSLENAGGVMMFAGMLLCFLPGSYYYWWSRRMKARPRTIPRPPRAKAPGSSDPFPDHRSFPSRWAWARSSSSSPWSSASGSSFPASVWRRGATRSDGRRSPRRPRLTGSPLRMKLGDQSRCVCVGSRDGEHVGVEINRKIVVQLFVDRPRNNWGLRS